MKITELDTLKEAGGYVARNAKEAADPRFSMSIGGDVTTHTMRDMIADFYPVKPQKGDKQSVVKESNKSKKGNRNYGMRKASGQGDNPMVAEKRPDHEVEMAKADVHKLAEYSAKLSNLIDNVSEEEGLPGWIQKKITLASDYIGSVYHKLDHEMGSPITESDTPGFDMINKIFDSLTDEEKVDIQRQLTVKVRGISVPPINPNIKMKTRNPNDNDIADMPLSQLQKQYRDVVGEGKKNKNKMGPQGITPGDRVEQSGKKYEVISVHGDIITVDSLDTGTRTRFKKDDVTRIFGADAQTDQDKQDMGDMFKRLDKVGSGSLKHVATEGDGRKKGIHGKGHPMRKKQQAAIHAGESAKKPLSRFSSEIGIQEIDCWDGYKKDGTKPGTGKNKGKRVNNCVKENVGDTWSVGDKFLVNPDDPNSKKLTVDKIKGNKLLGSDTKMYSKYAVTKESVELTEEITLSEDQNFHEEFGYLGYALEEGIFEAEYQGRKVKLNKPMRGDVKKFKVYVKDPKTGNVKKVNFGHGGTSAKKAGQKTMKIKKSNPARRKSFRARHNCDNPGPKTKARYWSCRAW
ncbi:hypothetical protein N9V27_01260 [bacterium]|nr:hypothetical protein [bacterium]